MTSFTDGIWNMVIFVGTVGGIIVLYVFVKNYSAGRPAGEGVQSMGHKWDGDLEELNNPLPRWWLNMFYITMIWGVIYLLLYPGVGTHPMLLGWSQVKQYDEQMAAAEERYGPIFEQFMNEDIAVVARSSDALKIGRRLFVNYCAGCHGSDAGGNPGFPNLRDNDWLHGGTPEAIKTTIMDGRNGVMPNWGEAVGEEGVKNLTQYVLSLNGRDFDGAAASAGEKTFNALCTSCHGKDGAGNPQLGGPDLTNNIWLYGGSPKSIAASIANGRKGEMPPHADFLGEAKSHLLAAYVFSLSKR
ncbi:MAG: cytochrome-c oxidase, cbb3-type subunit III [Gammaproteobacteria bacterium]|jgi:cytochrome c oxidase cbb3-type subunit 3|nr:cytochrome-c oxidase, cbb3-type subunit III [Gammaproteobacteria bacterium]NCF80614.1 cytochrome-c oxidase, cbb3-type subunit III [Pseudomonadota bacterium]